MSSNAEVSDYLYFYYGEASHYSSRFSRFCRLLDLGRHGNRLKVLLKQSCWYSASIVAGSKAWRCYAYCRCRRCCIPDAELSNSREAPNCLLQYFLGSRSGSLAQGCSTIDQIRTSCGLELSSSSSVRMVQNCRVASTLLVSQVWQYSVTTARAWLPLFGSCLDSRRSEGAIWTAFPSVCFARHRECRWCN